MAILGQWDSGTLPTTVGSGVSSAPTGGWNGGPAIQFDQVASQSSQVRFEFTSHQNVAVRAYLQMPAAWASAAEALIVVRPNSSSNVGQAVIAGTGSPGQARLIKADPGANAATSSTGTLSQSTWYRFELQLDQANGRGRLGIFPLASDTAVWESGWQTNDFGTSAYRVEIGPAYTSPTMGMVRAANILVSDDVTNWLGRAAGDGILPPSSNVLGQWDSGTLPTTIGTGVSYVANGGWNGGPAIQFDQQAGDVSQVRFAFSAANQLAMRAYIQMPSAWASAAQMLLMGRPNSAETSGRMALAGTSAPGQVRLIEYSGTTTVSSSTTSLVSTGQWYRFELQFNGVTGQARTAVFALGSDTPLWTSGWQTADFHMPSVYAEFGPGWAGTTLGQIRMTNLLVTDDISDWLGRVAGDDGTHSGGNVLGEWNSGALPTEVGAGVSYVATGGWDGRPAIQFNQQAGDSSQVRFEFSSVTTVAARAYIQMPAAWTPTSQALMIARFNSSTNVGQMNIGGTGSSGQVRLIKADPSATAASSSTGTVVQSTWYRFELQLNHTTGQGRTAVFALGSDTPLWDSGWVTNDFGTSTYRIEIGPAYTSPTMGQVRVANLKVTDSVNGWIGRAADDNGLPAPEPQTSWRIRTASGWVEAFAHDTFDAQNGLDPATTKLALIGDSLTASANGTSGSRESATRTVLQSTGLQNGNIFWYGRNNKGMTAADGNGKTVFANLTDAKTALGSVNIWVIALGTNNTVDGSPALSTTDFGNAMRAILDAIYTSPGVTERVLWVNTAFYNPSSPRSTNYNPVITSVIAEYPHAQVVDWYNRVHTPRDDADWASPGGGDDVHLTTAGYAKRDQFIANRVAALLT